RFQPIVPGVCSAIGTGALNVGSNSAVIVNRDDVLIVDSHSSPESGRLMLQELTAISDKPVRFLVNTHFRYDLRRFGIVRVLGRRRFPGSSSSSSAARSEVGGRWVG